jgi:O-antigen/teichoic acid export membrane protein
LRAKLQTNHLLNLDAFASISDRLIFIIFMIVGMFFSTIYLSSFIAYKTYSMFFALLIVSFFAFKYLPKSYFRFSFDYNKKKNLLIKSFPYALLAILMSIHDKVDQIMIERMVGPYESGIYAAAYRWLDAFMVYLWVLLPIFYTKFCSFINNRFELQKSFQLGQIIIFIPMIWIVAWVQFHGEYLFFLFDNASQLEVTKMHSVMSLLSFVLLIYSITTIYGTLITALAKEKYLILISLFSIVLNIGLNIVLIPLYQSNGAALATIISSFSVGVVHLYIIYTKKELNINYKLILHFIVHVIGAFVCFYLTIQLKLSFVFVLLFAALFFILLSLFTGLKKFISNQL